MKTRSYRERQRNADSGVPFLELQNLPRVDAPRGSICRCNERFTI